MFLFHLIHKLLETFLQCDSNISIKSLSSYVCADVPHPHPTNVVIRIMCFCYRAAVVDLLKVLSTIRCHDSIMAIAEKYHYEDAIYSHQLLNPETAWV